MADIEEAVELSRDDKPVALIAKFKTEHVAVCTQIDKEKKCYVTSRPQPAIYYHAQAFYTGIDPKLRVRKIHGEKSTVEEDAKIESGSEEPRPDIAIIVGDMCPPCHKLKNMLEKEIEEGKVRLVDEESEEAARLMKDVKTVPLAYVDGVRHELFFDNDFVLLQHPDGEKIVPLKELED